MVNRLLSLFPLLSRLVRSFNAAQSGQTGMEVALVVVCASCVLGGVLITTSDEAAAQLESVFHTGLDQASGTLILNGSVISTASGDPLSADSIVLTLGTIGEPVPVVLDQTQPDSLTLAFSNSDAFDNDVPYTAVELCGDGDCLLEAGETAQLTVPIASIGDGTLHLGPMQSWTLQVSAPSGGIVEVTRTMPFALDAVNSLR
jgi:archaellin